MPISFVGSYPDRERVLTKCVSLNMAVSGINFERKLLPGLPMRSGYHIWSKETGIGKTHIALSLIGKVAAYYKSDVAITPVDTFDVGNMQSILEWAGMEGVVHIVLNEKGHAKTLEDLNETLYKRGICASLLDSAYAVMSTAVEDGGTEDANMGKDAKMISTYARQAKGKIDASKKEPKIFVVTNMSFINMNARRAFGPPPYEPARGRTLMGQTSIHIDLSQGYIGNKAARFDKGRLVIGKIKKNNFGPADREFAVFVIGGLGIHDGITAAYDCVGYGLASMKGSKFIIDGQTICTPEAMIDNYQDPSIFEPFFNALDENKDAIYAGEITKSKASYGKKKKDEPEIGDVDEDEIETDGMTPEELME